MHFGQRFQDGLHLNGRHILSGQHKCFEVVFLISLKCLKTGTSIKLCKSIIFKKKKKIKSVWQPWAHMAPCGQPPRLRYVGTHALVLRLHLSLCTFQIIPYRQLVWGSFHPPPTTVVCRLHQNHYLFVWKQIKVCCGRGRSPGYFSSLRLLSWNCCGYQFKLLSQFASI